MKKSISICIFLFVFFFLFPREADAKPPSVSSHVDKESITIGDEIVYEIRVTYSKGIVVELPQEETDFSPFELKRYRPLPRRELGNQITEGKEYFLTIFRLGTWEIPSLMIFYTDYRERSLPESSYRSSHSIGGDMGARRSISTNPIEIRVKSVLGEEISPTLDIQRLKPPVENPLMSFFKRVGVIFISIGALCIGIYGVIRLLPKPVPRIIREDPVESSLRDLMEFKKKLNGQTVSVTHYEALSKILRRYLARQFDPLTLDLTTAELRHQMSQYRPCQVVTEKVYHILMISDLVKFANRGGSQEELDTFLKETEEIIHTIVLPAPTPT